MGRHRDPAVTSRIMSAVRSKNTQPELMLRRELHRRGLRYRLHADLPGRPDIVFSRVGLAVFVDGDFWHGHGWRERGFASFEEQFVNYRDPEKWRAKIRSNVDRDLHVNVALQGTGWEVVRVLESQVRADVASVANRLQDILRARGGKPC
ncbi:MAG: very short patch repair endonuclease [Mycobacteriales bacterium]